MPAAPQYDCDLAPGRGAIPPDTCIILRHYPDTVYTVWTGRAWELYSKSNSTPDAVYWGTFPSYLEAVRFHRGDPTWRP